MGRTGPAKENADPFLQALLWAILLTYGRPPTPHGWLIHPGGGDDPVPPGVFWTQDTVYRPRLVRHRIACYAASAAGESWFCRTAAGVWNPCRSMSQVVL